ncbi:cupin domain-containing protein [Microbispora bryophytorum]|uniref:cupin domain-containing protein n=1 Tax=Microbispora bryophytorum TaxID=1460882 RepID=UPI0033E498AF
MSTSALYAGAARARGRSALARCVGDVDEFLATVWTRRHQHRVAAEPAAFADLFGEDSLRHVLTHRELRVGRHDLRLMQTVDGRFSVLDPAQYTVGSEAGDDRVDGAAVDRLLRSGASLALQLVDRYWRPLERFCRDLELFLGHPCQATAYVTPPAAQGLDVHHDLHDVLVLMIAGEKEFTLYEPVIEDPVRGQMLSSLSPSPHLQEIATMTLRPGDVLYIPRGMPHVALTGAHRSTHLTIGVRAATWHALAAEVAGKLVDECAADREMRRSIPVGALYGGRAYESLADEQAERLAGIVRELARRAFREGLTRTMLAARLTDYGDGSDWLDRVAAPLTAERAKVRLRPGALVHITRRGDEAEVRLSGGRILRTGLTEADALAEILSAPGGGTATAYVSPAGPASPLIRLVRVLLEEGVLEMATTP